MDVVGFPERGRRARAPGFQVPEPGFAVQDRIGLGGERGGQRGGYGQGKSGFVYGSNSRGWVYWVWRQ